MKQIINLTGIELFKIFRQKRTYYGIAAVLVIEAFILLGSYVQGKEIIEVLLSSLAENFVLEGNLMNSNLVLYLVLNSLWFNLPLILMIVVSGFVTIEFKDKTIQSLILQNVSRTYLATSKFLAAICFTVFVLLILMASSWITAYLIFGKGDLITYLNGLNFYEQSEAVRRIFWSFLNGSFSLVFYSVASITLAFIFRETTITWILSALFLIITNLALKIDFGALNHWLFPKLIDTWQYLFYYEIPMDLIIHNQLVLSGYTVLIALMGIVTFNKTETG